jgi:hypothetical protein
MLRLLRMQLMPRLAPLGLRSSRGRAYVFRTVAQLRIHYRRSPAVLEGEPALRRGPKAGDRLPDVRIAGDRQAGWLQDALAAPRFHLLLCGPANSWDADHLAALQQRCGGLVAVRRLAREAAPGALHDPDGQAFARLGVDRAAQYLVRPDCHIGYRCAGTELGGVDRYLARWFRRAGREADHSSRDTTATSHE